MAVLSRNKTTLPAIPKVNVSDPHLQRFCDTVTQFCAIHAGNVGSGLDRAITVREMINSGFAVRKSTSTSTSTGGGSTDIVPPTTTDPEYPVEKPTQPTGFRVISGTTAIMLVWDDVNFKGAGSTIIYRASSDDFSTAVILAETPAAVYSDITDNSDPYWYWIRHTNINGDEGALNDASGTMGQAGLLTSNPDGETMIASELVAFAIYATELTAVHITGGDMDFAGGRFTVDVNGNCTASSLTINNGGYCRSENYAAGVSGWAIYGNGDCEFNNGTFRGNVYAEDGYFKGAVYADRIVGDVVSGKLIALDKTKWTAPGALGYQYDDLFTFTVTNSSSQVAYVYIPSFPYVFTYYGGNSMGTSTAGTRILIDDEVYDTVEVIGHYSENTDTSTFDVLGASVSLGVKLLSGETKTIKVQRFAYQGDSIQIQTSNIVVNYFIEGKSFE